MIDRTLPSIKTQIMLTLRIISYLLQEMIMEKLLFTVTHLLSKTQNISKEKAIPVMSLQSDGQKMIPELSQLEEKTNVLWSGRCKKWAVLRKIWKTLKKQINPNIDHFSFFFQFILNFNTNFKVDKKIKYMKENLFYKGWK